MADVCPSTGWPFAGAGYLTRSGVTAPWEAAPPHAGHSHLQEGRAANAHDDEADSPEDIALVDPMAGALQMDLLQRIRYLLTSRHAPVELPLLAVLATAVRMSSETAMAVVKEPGLLGAVGFLLDPAMVSAATGAAGGAVGLESWSGGGRSPAVQIAALMVVRLLCCSSSVLAHLVRSAGDWGG